MMIHPATVHFAMILPLVAATFGVIYIFNRTETMAKISARTALLAAIAMIGVWYTGEKIAGPEVFGFLDTAGKAELLEHRDLGRYLAVAMAIVALIQIIGCRMKKGGIQIFGILLTIAVMAVTFLQGKHGGEIVYEHGNPFQMTQLKKYIANDEDFDMADDDEKVELIQKQISVINETTCEKIGCEDKEQKSKKIQEDDD
ncbi:DUF2231 domain-containing protein [Sulfurimonas sp.]|uniref:DUF2231 domain-containing protein n=1 Tax=Sulfurimonas sp. TaxID=2022749 RepID=UPI002612F0B2|nr:DUF2231 domain-containing protein [Sulfurimonas sp.]